MSIKMRNSLVSIMADAATLTKSAAGLVDVMDGFSRELQLANDLRSEALRDLAIARETIIKQKGTIKDLQLKKSFYEEPKGLIASPLVLDPAVGRS